MKCTRIRAFLAVLAVVMSLLVTYLPIVAGAQNGNQNGPNGNSQTGYRVLVDTNEMDRIDPNESSQVDLLACDGSSSIPGNGPKGAITAPVLKTLGPFVMSEDNPTSVESLNGIAGIIGRVPDASLQYTQQGTSLATVLTDAEIQTAAKYNVNYQGTPYGILGPRVVVLTRDYNPSDPRFAYTNTALQDPNVLGICFEFNPDIDAYRAPLDQEGLNLAGFVRATLAAGKKALLLMPPNPSPIQDYVSAVMGVVEYLGELAASPDVFLELATYPEPGSVHFLSLSANDRNSVQAAIAALLSYRATTWPTSVAAPKPTPTAQPSPSPTPTRGGSN